MFKNLFGRKKSFSKTGFFRFEKDCLVAVDVIPGNGSINSWIESVGFASNQIHTVHTFESALIECLGFKMFTDHLVFVLTKPQNLKLSFSDVKEIVKGIDWGYEYSSLNIESVLQGGIDARNFSFKFLDSVTELTEEFENLYRAEKLKFYLQFENEILVAFTSIDLQSPSTKYLARLNQPLIQRMIDEARLFHKDDIDSMIEVNKQSDALMGMPDSVKNKFIPLHTKPNGNVSFYNLLVTHYSDQVCNIEEFLFMNKGRYKTLDESTIEVGRFIYSFDDSGELGNVVKK